MTSAECSAGSESAPQRRDEMTFSQPWILADFPDLEPEDLSAALDYAAQEIDHPVLMG